jgi:glycosyltransferase involved in cell wall biosynthesis
MVAPLRDPDVTVVIPCYQQADYLGDAIASVLAQGFKRWEIVVVSGCPESAALTLSLIAKLGDHRVRLVENATRGVADARNAGIEQARGRLVLPLDADDMLLPQFLERAIASVDPARRYSIVSTSLQEFGERHGAWDLPLYSAGRLLDVNCLSVASVFTKALWTAAGGYDVALPVGYEDWSFWIACSKHAPEVVQIPDRLLRYRVHGASSTARTIAYDAYMRAMVCVAQSDLYPRLRVVRAHEVLKAMPEKVLEMVERRMQDFDRANLFFFHGLSSEARGDISRARSDYGMALQHSRTFHWQAAHRLAALANGAWPS